MTRALFMGTPAAAVPALSALTGVAWVVGVVTQPDAARKRRGKSQTPAVKVAAQEWGIPVAQPTTDDDLIAALLQHHFDVGVVVAYGRLLPPAALNIPQFGYLNIHFSMLPRWRGAAPVARAILNGDEASGVSIMKLDKGLDTGPVVAASGVDIAEDDTAGTLTARLAHTGADLLIDSLEAYICRRRVPAPQIGSANTMAKRMTTSEGQIHGQLDIVHAERLVRACNPRPGAWMLVDDGRIKVLAAQLSNHNVPAGEIHVLESEPVLGLQGGSIQLGRVQPAGQRPMSGRAWANGRRNQPATTAAPI